tara:strand:+ start:4879 stop:5301 length:423 start_codon:yes stop_codon:yes gene_type:complete
MVRKSVTLPEAFEQFSVGFSPFFEWVDNFNGLANQTYPPHNIVKLTETQYHIEIATSGFAKNQLNVELNDGELLVTGSQETNNDDREYLHKGISTKSFKKRFKLAEYVDVKDVFLNNGLLVVSLERSVPEEKKPKVFDIG